MRPAVRVVDQGVVALGLPCVQGLLQGIEDEVGAHGTAHTPAHDAPGEDINDEGHVQPALPGRHVREVGHPELIGPVGLEDPVDPIQRARCLGIANRGAHDLAAHHAAQPETTHQPLDRATRTGSAFAVHLLPDLVGTVDLHVVDLPDLFDMRNQLGISLGASAAQRRIALLSNASPIPGRGDLQNPADRLDPEPIAMLVDE